VATRRARLELGCSVRGRTGVVGLPAMLVDGGLLSWASAARWCPVLSVTLGWVWPRCGPAVLWEITFWRFSCCWVWHGGQWA
jgi:hypothetical protein